MDFACKILADSLNPVGDRLTTFEVTYPRFIHAEILTHRDKSRNSASSRAIPVEKMLENILNHPVVPIHWGKNQKGMQAYDVLDVEDQVSAANIWLDARDAALDAAWRLNELGIHKQIVNRLVEPFMWITVIISGTNWKHQFGLRCHEAAEPHFQKISYMMKEAYEANEPVPLKVGEWHLPLIGFEGDEVLSSDELAQVSTARCARVSYLTHDGKRDVQADLDLHERLHTGGHWSPFEHPAQALDSHERHGNFTGFKQYRKFFQEEYLT